MNEILLSSFGFCEEVGLLETSFHKRVTSLTSAALEAALVADSREKRRSPGYCSECVWKHRWAVNAFHRKHLKCSCEEFNLTSNIWSSDVYQIVLVLSAYSCGYLFIFTSYKTPVVVIWMLGKTGEPHVCVEE